MRRRSAHGVAATLDYLITPEIESAFVRLSSQEIEIVLPHEVLGDVDGIANKPDTGAARKDASVLLPESREGAVFGLNA